MTGWIICSSQPSLSAACNCSWTSAATTVGVNPVARTATTLCSITEPPDRACSRSTPGADADVQCVVPVAIGGGGERGIDLGPRVGRPADQIEVEAAGRDEVQRGLHRPEAVPPHTADGDLLLADDVQQELAGWPA